jgi:hypothetical protein
MGGFLFWLVLVVCVLVLVALLFPFRFRVEFEAGEHGCKARLFFFKKKLWSGEKKWGRGKRRASAHEDDEDSSDNDITDDDAFMPEFVATAPKKPVESKPAPVAEKKATPAKVEKVDSAPTPAPTSAPIVESKPVPENKPAHASQETPSVKEPASVASTASIASTSSATDSTTDSATEKRKLTDAEFWTILLTPDLDSRAFRYVKSLLAIIVRLFNIRFENCFVEGIRSDYRTMGYGAAANAVLKGFPYLESWDFRMDWCRDKDLHAEGTIHARTNLCRGAFLLLAALFYAGILFLSFWRRRARVLKTGELPELGFIRKKIVGWMVEE